MKQVESAKAKGSRQKRRNVVIFFDAGKVLRRPEWLVPRCFALHFTWSETMRVKFHELASDLLEGNPPLSEVDWHNPTIQEIFTYMSFWYGSLYVVIEGWKQLRLRDGPVELLLSFTNVDLLKRYRNGTFHFQRHYFDSRRVAFVELGPDNYAGQMF